MEKTRAGSLKYGVGGSEHFVDSSITTTPAVDLTAVVITRNEEERIEECLRSTFAAIEEAQARGVIRTAEILLVDSASTDRTVEIARRFAVDIIQLPATWTLSAGAGSLTGLRNARGTFTAILNGDMSIDRRWFVDALPYLTAGVGGLIGVAKEDLRGRTLVERFVRRSSNAPLSIGTLSSEIATHPGGYSLGTFLLRTDAARKVGGYNPYYRAAEDTEMRYHLESAGLKVLNVPVLQGVHYWSDAHEPLDVLPYYRTLYRNSVGLGQVSRGNRSSDRATARRATQDCLNARILRQVTAGLLGLAWAALHAATLAAIRPDLLGILLIGDALAVFLSSQRARVAGSPVRDHLFATAGSPLPFALVRVAGFLRGLLLPRRRPEDYPVAPRAGRTAGT